MKTIRGWLDEYQESHLNPVNKALHWLCIPPIVFSVMLALKAIPLGNAWLNAATFVGALALVYYFFLSWQLALGVALVFGVMYAGVLAIDAGLGAGGSALVAAAIFILAWIGQFIGHHYEGKRPSFFKDVQFLLIGPLWLLADVYRRLDVAFDDRRVAHG